MRTDSTGRGPPDDRSILAWTLQIVLAGVFVVTGAATLAQAPGVVDSIDQIGLGNGFRVTAGVVQVVGAAAISLPDVAVLGALWLAVAMGLAVLVHLYILQDNPARAVVLLLLSLLVVVLRRDQMRRLRTRLL